MLLAGTLKETHLQENKEDTETMLARIHSQTKTVTGTFLKLRMQG